MSGPLSGCNHENGAAVTVAEERLSVTERELGPAAAAALLELESQEGSKVDAGAGVSVRRNVPSEAVITNEGEGCCSLTSFSAKLSSICSYLLLLLGSGILLRSFFSLCCFSLNTSHHLPNLLAVLPGTSAAIFFHLLPYFA
ncbi:hypothetical protein V8G54_009180 [Vigna mungo]|uniref:Uncharacterized protein n=1 Tax=Vigna mungo TaxID=3915 RepID=A0AAQ3NVB3_VIGMU